jgi:hypothetical protein
MGHSNWSREASHSSGQMTATQRLAYADDNVHEFLDGSRQADADALVSFRNLRSIEIDFKNEYCPLGSCREVSLNREQLVGHVQKFRLIGLRSREKDETLSHWLELIELEEDEFERRFQVEFELQALSSSS